eukprot:scaffold45460_cov67-Phaeocystis_antarctica.AAC.5
MVCHGVPILTRSHEVARKKETLTHVTLGSIPPPGPPLTPPTALGVDRHDACLPQPLQHALWDHVRDRLALGILDVH